MSSNQVSIDGQMVGWLDDKQAVYMDGRVDGGVYGWMDGWMAKWMDSIKHKQTTDPIFCLIVRSFL